MSEAAQELIVIPQETALQVFTTAGAMEPYLEQIKAAVDGIVPDLTTKKGRDAVASLAFKVTKSKTYIEGVGKGLADQQKEIPKKIDATRKLARDFLDDLATQVRKPLTDWEAEQARLEREAREKAQAIQAAIDSIAAWAVTNEFSNSHEIQDRIDQLNSLELTEDKFGDRLSDASLARTQALGELQVKLERRKQYEADQEELARLRAAQAEREAAQQQVAEQQPVADLPEQAPEQVPEHDSLELRYYQVPQDEQPAVDPMREHRKAVNTDALNAFIEGGLSPEAAKLAVTLIAQRRIPAVSIAY